IPVADPSHRECKNGGGHDDENEQDPSDPIRAARQTGARSTSPSTLANRPDDTAEAQADHGAEEDYDWPEHQPAHVIQHKPAIERQQLRHNATKHASAEPCSGPTCVHRPWRLRCACRLVVECCDRMSPVRVGYDSLPPPGANVWGATLV